MVHTPVMVGALGASTPLGRDAWSSAAAVRAGISAFAEHPFMLDAFGEPMRVALAPWLHDGCLGASRFEALLLPAIEQALLPIDGAAGLRVGLALALPSARPGLPVGLEPALRASIARVFASRFVGIATFPIGHAAGLLAMDAAHRKISTGAFDACVVAGVESYLEPATLEWLEANEQLHGAGVLNNAWGFIPGEAAGAVLLVRADAVPRIAADPLGLVLRVGSGVERNRIKTETVCIGEGLTAAFREALAALPSGARVTDIFCDMNGEPYRADEYGFTCLRTKEAFVAASDFVAPADCWGDVSAASSPLCLILATIASLKGYARGAHALLWASSESGERGAALLTFATPVEQQWA
jgi:3-oxoacyl-[acyl-carrier-protein] synthase-1